MKNKLLILLIIILFIFVLFVVYYGTNSRFLDENEMKNPISFIVEDGKKHLEDIETKDKDLYSKNIISNLVTSYDYELILGDNSIYGKVYIKNGYLFISNAKNNTINRVSDYLIKTLLVEENNKNMLSFNALSTDGKVYYFLLSKLDITKYTFYEIKSNFITTNFTDLTLNSLDNINISNLIVLAEDGNFYDINTGIRYNAEITSLNDQYYIYADNTIANFEGNMIKDGGEYLKIKYFIQTPENDRPFKGINSIIITQDDKLIYSEDNDNLVYQHRFKVKEITHKELGSGYRTIKIIFEDGSRINFTGYCGNLYNLQ